MVNFENPPTPTKIEIIDHSHLWNTTGNSWKPGVKGISSRWLFSYFSNHAKLRIYFFSERLYLFRVKLILKGSSLIDPTTGRTRATLKWTPTSKRFLTQYTESHSTSTAWSPTSRKWLVGGTVMELFPHASQHSTSVRITQLYSPQPLDTLFPL